MNILTEKQRELMKHEFWLPFFDAWAFQGRTEEQQWAVINFMTGQGGIMIETMQETIFRLLLW